VYASSTLLTIPAESQLVNADVAVMDAIWTQNLADLEGLSSSLQPPRRLQAESESPENTDWVLSANAAVNILARVSGLAH
jgi:hypothetical protein